MLACGATIQVCDPAGWIFAQFTKLCSGGGEGQFLGICRLPPDTSQPLWFPTPLTAFRKWVLGYLLSCAAQSDNLAPFSVISSGSSLQYTGPLAIPVTAQVAGLVFDVDPGDIAAELAELIPSTWPDGRL